MFQPARLVQAREFRGWAAVDLARALRVTSGAVSQWEAPGASLPHQRLYEVARLLRFPPSFFERPDPHGGPQCFYRARSRITRRTRARIEARAALWRELLDVFDQDLDLPAPNLPNLASLPPAAAAVECRRYWGLGDGPIRNVVDLLESNGIWFHVLDPDEGKEVDAFSFWSDGRPNIVLNHTNQDRCRSRFDALHELGHLVLHADRTVEEREKEANAFASAFLLPAATWGREASSVQQRTSPWSYHRLKERWGGSVKAQMYRACDLGLLDRRGFQCAMVRYSQVRLSGGEPDDGPPEAPRILGLALAAYHRRGLTLADIAARLDLTTEVLAEMIPSDALAAGRPARPALCLVSESA